MVLLLFVTLILLIMLVFVESTCDSMIFSLQKWQRYTERQPLRFYDRELLPHLAYVTRRLAKFVGLTLFYLSIKSFFFIVMSYKNAFLYKRIFCYIRLLFKVITTYILWSYSFCQRNNNSLLYSICEQI